MKGLYEAEDYKVFISNKLEENREDRSYRTKLVAAMSCQLSFFSQVMHSHVHITPDHAVALTNFWGMKPEDAEFFLDLVLLARAGSPHLKTLLGQRIASARRKRGQVNERFKNTKRIQSVEAQAFYYGSWHVSAIHVMVSIDAFKTAHTIAKHLGITVRAAEEALGGLERHGLISAKKNGGWNVTEAYVHLNDDSPMWTAHQMNWLARTYNYVQSKSQSGHLFLTYATMSEKDYDRLRREIASAVERFSKEIINPSEPEVLICFNTNLFKV